MHEKGGDSSTTYATLTEGTQVVLIQNSAGNLTKPTPTTGAPRNKIQLMDGFYLVDGLKISDSYYERLWKEGRSIPTSEGGLRQQSCDLPVPRGAPGYFRYEGAGLEVIYDPITGQIGHIQPVRKK